MLGMGNWASSKNTLSAKKTATAIAIIREKEETLLCFVYLQAIFHTILYDLDFK